MSFVFRPGPLRALLAGTAALAVFASFALPSALQSPPDHPPAASVAPRLAMAGAASAAASASRPGSDRAASFAASRVAAGGTRKQPATERQLFGEHRQPRSLAPAQRAPQQPLLPERADSAYDGAALRRDPLKRPSLLAAARSAKAAACDPASFGALSGAALASAVRAAAPDCINQLFGLSGSQAYATFREAQMVSVADAFAASARAYDGTNNAGTLQLVLFLRAGYYVQYYDSAVGSYGANLRNAIRPALDAFAANANFGRVDDAHGEILAEYVTLIDSATENARYLYVVKRLLDAYDSRFDAFYWMKVAVNNAYTVTFRGHQDAAFRALVQSDTSIVDTLYNFANRNFALLGGDRAYLVSNAGREMARFLQYDGALKTLARSRAKALIDRSAITGATARLWVGIGEMAQYYDAGNCAYYGQCDFAARLEAAALPIRHTCSATLTLRAQQMSASELAGACATVAGQEAYFHRELATGGVPVAGDNNASLEMAVFDSSDDYGIYAGAIFGIDTNNGGMYLEGDPSAPGNQARFIAYEAEWLRPNFEIWNLTHEYVHYLDGRFNMWGDFQAAMRQKTVWWVEGFAEYLSYQYREVANDGAIAEAARGTYALSTVYANDYDSGTNRVYRWGYLAVRFMFEQRRTQVNAILAKFRPGDYTGYATYMAGIGQSNDAAFKAWLPCVADPAGSGCGGTPNQPPTANFSVAASGLSVNFSDTSSDSDGRIVARSWNFGDGTGSTAANPSKTYAAGGSYTVSLTVTDDRGATATATRSITVSEPGLPECSGSDARTLGRNCSRSNAAATVGNYAYFYLYLPAGVSQLRIDTAGGSGNADLYVSAGNWPSRDSYQYRSAKAGNAESVTIANPPAGYVYVAVHAASAFSGVKVSARY
ncbi:collagenase [Lysobacter enzymogenes]|uniref:collagenase n=1 Tax=Lysobacter enzymogenes TaxID=69 RepID=UPI001AF62BF9|nr:collagenase [Lysobacter enzymogenes]QQQ01136.1 collagenase [Lysobacter enzymogenes]